MYHTFRLYFLFILITLQYTASGQRMQLNFQHITPQEGLTQNVVTAFEQDTMGFIWIGTLEGLNRYDGKNIKQFRRNIKDSTSLSNGEINDLHRDKKGRLWVATSRGINRYQQEQRNFKEYKLTKNRRVNLGEAYCNVIHEDSDTTIWFGTYSGIAKLKEKTGHLVYSNPSGFAPEGSNIIFDIQNLTPDTLLLGTASGIYKFSKSSHSFIPLQKHSALKRLDSNTITNLLITPEKRMWIGTQQGAYQYNPATNTLRFYGKGKQSLSNEKIRDISRTQDGKIWFATNFGLNYYNPQDSSIYHYTAKDEQKSDLISNMIRTVFQDKTGVVWIGQLGGASKFDKNQIKFSKCSTRDIAVNNETINDPVWNFTIDSSGYLWVGTMANVAYVSEEPWNGTCNFISVAELIPEIGQTSIKSAYFIEETKPDEFWLGTDLGLVYYNRSRNIFEHLKPKNGNPHDLQTYNLISYATDHKGNFWLGTLQGIQFFNPDTRKFYHYSHIPNKPTSLGGDVILDLMFDKEKRKLWIGTKKAGVSTLNLDTFYKNRDKEPVFNTIAQKDSATTSLPDMTIMNMLKDSKGFIWFATSHGMSQYNPRKKTFTNYLKKDGLPDNTINAIVEDNQYNLWISTNKGISKFNTAEQTFTNFTQANGLQNDEFNSNSLYKHSDGTIFFGGIKGFNFFNPAKITANPFPPRIAITALRIYNTPVGINQPYNGHRILSKSVELTDTIILNYKQNYLSIGFAALHYTNPQENRCAYKLEGLHDNYIYAEEQKMARYTNLDPGKYTFKVKAANADGIWTDTPKTLYIRIKPPFWQTAWFIGGSIVIGILLIIILIKLRDKSLQKSKTALEAEVQRRTHEISKTQEELRKSKAFTESIISNAKDGIAVFDLESNFKKVNKSLCSILGREEAEIVNRQSREITPERWHKMDKEYLNKVNNGESIYYEKEYITKAGHAMPVSISASLIQNRDEAYIIAIINDISQRKKNEKALEENRQQLEQLVDERTQDLMKAKKKAEHADKLKSAFLANMSHEVRTPMNAIVGFSQLLNARDFDKGEKQEFIREIQRNTNDLLNLIENIIEISRIEAGEIELQYTYFSLPPLMDQLREEAMQKIGQAGKTIDVKISTDPTEQINCDKIRIEKIFKALIDNAIKFTNTGNLLIGYRQVTHNGRPEIEFFVEDTGIGIDENDQEKIFKPFDKLETNIDKFQPGAGLGLSIVNKSIEMLKGKINVHSQPRQGSRFAFVLPLEGSVTAPGQPSGQKVPPHHQSLKGKKILVAEDEIANYRFINISLKKYEAEILWAKTGQEAIDLCRNNGDIHVVLLDLKMPEMDGYDALPMIREICPETPVIAQTAYAMSEDRKKVSQAGFDDYLAKPYSLNELINTLFRNME